MLRCNKWSDCPISDECGHGESHEHNEECKIPCRGAIDECGECIEEVKDR